MAEDAGGRGEGLLGRSARWSYRRRWWVLAGWTLLLAAAAVLGSRFGGVFANAVTLPGTESQRAADLLDERFPALAGDSGLIVFRAERGVADPAVRARMEGLFTRAAGIDNVVAVASPYDPGVPATSPDGRIAFATVQFDVKSMEIPEAVIGRLEAMVERANVPGVQVELGGAAIAHAQQQFGTKEAIGLVAAVLILLLAFGSLIAAGLPVLTAAFGIGVGIASIQLLAQVIDVPDPTPQFAMMIGLGVGIDYALLIVTRFRQGLREGLDPLTATARAAETAGRSVILAGVTVVISLLGIFLMGLSFVNGLAVGGIVVVLLTMLATMTLLPAGLGFTGRRIDRFRVPGLARPESMRRTLSFRWSRQVQRHPWRAATAALIVLVPLVLPMFSLRLGVADAGRDPASFSTRRAYDLISQGFGPGFNGPLLLATELAAPEAAPALERLGTALGRDPGVAYVAAPQLNTAGDTAVLTVFPRSAPQDEGTERLVQRLRDAVIPRAVAGTGATVSVGGITAAFIDVTELLARRLPYVIGVVVAFSFLVLMSVFRSLLVPLKAAVMNLLSVGAAYGVIVAIFQWGWLKDLVGIDRTGPVESYLPAILFAVLFGLSMDYEVFLLSRIREEYVRTRDNGIAVANGLGATARVITAAAAIMVTVFLAFALGDLRVIKLLGVGLAVAILIDATLVRLVLVPATMELLGKANWWFPRFLDRVVPRLGAEEPGPVPPPPPDPATPGRAVLGAGRREWSTPQRP